MGDPLVPTVRLSPGGHAVIELPQSINGHGPWLRVWVENRMISMEVHTDAEVASWARYRGPQVFRYEPPQ